MSSKKEEESRAIRIALNIADEIRQNWTRGDRESLVESFNTIGGLSTAIRILKEKGFEKQISQIPVEHLEIAIEELISAL